MVELSATWAVDVVKDVSLIVTENAPRTATPVLLKRYIVSPLAHAVKDSGSVETPARVSLSLS